VIDDIKKYPCPVGKRPDYNCDHIAEDGPESRRCLPDPSAGYCFYPDRTDLDGNWWAGIYDSWKAKQ
jgi:hypothetical protein